MNRIPSIFNDALGPIMIGASSSHTAASVRIGAVVRQIAAGAPKSVKIMVDRHGSLATTYRDQGADIGFAAGLLGYSAASPELTDSLEIAKRQGIDITFHIGEFVNDHPNTYLITIEDVSGSRHEVVCVSCGGGLISIRRIDHLETDYSGENYGLCLLHCDKANREQLLTELKGILSSAVSHADFSDCHTSSYFLNLGEPIPHTRLQRLQALLGGKNVISLSPVMPSQSNRSAQIPFFDAESLLSYCQRERISLEEAATRFEITRSNTTIEQIWAQIREIIKVAREGIDFGQQGRYYQDRILPAQAHLIRLNQGKTIPNSLLNKILAYVSSLMDAKSAMRPIVACPTAGSCGILPGTLIALCEEMGWDDDMLGKGLLCAGIVGVLINNLATFSAEECGCQAECGSSSAMTAAAISYLHGGDTKQALDAAAFALQNMLGSICDPVGMRVEVPCLGKNIMGSMNALASANMSLAGYYNPIPLDQTIQCMYDVGVLLPPQLRCTGKGGLSQTPAALEIQEKFHRRREAR